VEIKFEPEQTKNICSEKKGKNKQNKKLGERKREKLKNKRKDDSAIDGGDGLLVASHSVHVCRFAI
jgi:hypothetical protein